MQGFCRNINVTDFMGKKEALDTKVERFSVHFKFYIKYAFTQNLEDVFVRSMKKHSV